MITTWEEMRDRLVKDDSISAFEYLQFNAFVNLMINNKEVLTK